MNRRGALCGLASLPISAMPATRVLAGLSYNNTSWDGGEYIDNIWVDYLYRTWDGAGFDFESYTEHRGQIKTLAYKFTIPPGKWGQFFILTDESYRPGSDEFKILLGSLRDCAARNILICRRAVG